jgi:Lipocalin-like domain
MNRRDVLGTSAVTALGALLPATAFAQQKTLKDQLVGSWTLVSNDAMAPDGKKDQFYGPNPKGVLILDSVGRYASILARPDRPKLKSASRFDLDASPAELKALLLGFGASSGTWSIDEANKTLVRRVEASIIPNNEGSEQKASVALSGDDLTITQTSSTSGVKSIAVYRRAKTTA